MSNSFDERLAYVQEGDKVHLETRNGNYDVTVDEVNYTVNGDGNVESVRITPENLIEKGQIFTYRRSKNNYLKPDSFQPDKVVYYELEDSWNSGLGSEKALEKVAEVLDWEDEQKKDHLEGLTTS